ncbi:hypothetical protein [Nguyenibacter vanlangensis]|uniref:Uncharacterized protein n=1 Tax=Nguyenibacter vanlangensis TaxID=1216886 RepID=A0A7Y7IT08_9PROT|nr:hypothetical protein [Nguyenibacter vanlangensis]NVN09568.1 hypothetical protein [Nguyenibacter vanlangensis]
MSTFAAFVSMHGLDARRGLAIDSQNTPQHAMLAHQVFVGGDVAFRGAGITFAAGGHRVCSPAEPCAGREQMATMRVLSAFMN